MPRQIDSKKLGSIKARKPGKKRVYDAEPRIESMREHFGSCFATKVSKAVVSEIAWFQQLTSGEPVSQEL